MEPVNTVLAITRVGLVDESIFDIEDIVIGDVSISITSTTTTTVNTPPITTTIMTTTVTSYFPTPTRPIQMTTIAVEGRGVMNFVFFITELIAKPLGILLCMLFV